MRSLQEHTSPMEPDVTPNLTGISTKQQYHDCLSKSADSNTQWKSMPLLKTVVLYLKQSAKQKVKGSEENCSNIQIRPFSPWLKC